MEYITTISAHEPIVITIGNFDGVHTGHQYLLRELHRMAEELMAKPVLVTFSPHTLLVIQPESDLHCLTTLEEKVALAKEWGNIADTIVIKFTPEIVAMSATDFLEHVRTRFLVRGVVIGANFSLGHNRIGNAAFIKQYGQQHSMVVRSLPLIKATTETPDLRISSTRIRTLMSDGQIAEANELLGHSFRLNGVVVHGDHRGRQLGFPTANLAIEAHKLLPANGVYVVRVHIDTANSAGRDSLFYNGVANIGVRPTFHGKQRIIEVHILDADRDLYGQSIRLDFVSRLRGEQRFAGIDELKEQIAVDVQAARQILQ